jgi:ribosomal protein S18 acetylase RimI-like enzyme
MNVRTALPSDLDDLLALDSLCFSADDPTVEPPEPDDLKSGVENRTVLLIEENQEITAFAHYVFPSQDHAYLNAVGVRPDRRRQGRARKLIDKFFEEVREASPKCSISAVASIENEPTASLLLSMNFVIRTIMKDYYAPGRDRLYFQYKFRVEYLDPDERFVVPLTARPHMESLLADDRYVITRLVRLPVGSAFEFSRFDREDFAALESNETAAGVQFSGVILSSIAFVLGFSLSSPRYPEAARVLLLCATLATTLSLIVYANTSGDTARLRSNSFTEHMKWGNILSEFGGVFPFLISLPVTFAAVSGSRPAALIVSGIFSVGMTLYNISRFSLSRRFDSSAWTRLTAAVVCASPVGGTLGIRTPWIMWTWTSTVIIALTVLSGIYTLRREEEKPPGDRSLEWMVRA